MNPPRTYRQRSQILYLTHRVPFPPNRGDRIRSFHTLRFLAQRCDVHLACLADEPVSDEVRAELESRCRRLAVAQLPRKTRWLRALGSVALGRTATEGLFASRFLQRELQRWCADTQFDAVLVYCSSMWQFASSPPLMRVPRVVDLVDVDSQKFHDYAASIHGLKKWLYRLEARRLRRLERGLPTRCRAVTLVSEDEASVYRDFAEPGRIQAITNGVDLEYFRPQSESVTSPFECVFVGVLDYWPNVEGVTWFGREIWPSVRQRFPQAVFSLVGRRPADEVRCLAQLPGVRVVGEVPDVRPFLARAALVVAPLRIARGVQNKVLEALAMGKAVVASGPATEGLRVTPGSDLVRLDRDGEWAETVCSLLANPKRRAELGTQGRRCVEDQYRWDRCLAPLAELFEIAPSG